MGFFAASLEGVEDDSMIAELAEQLIRFHLDGSEETIGHIVTTLRLAEAGITAQLVARAPVVDEQAERRRARDRERKRLARGISADEPDESADTVEIPPNSETVSPKKGPPHPLENTPLPQKQKLPEPMPLDWKPNAEALAVAASLRFDPVALSYELARFSAWAASTDQRKADWQACFIYWLRNGKPKAFKLHTVPVEKAPVAIDCLVKFADSIANAPESWKRVCTRLRDEVGIAVYSSWFTNMELDRIDNGMAILTVPSKFLKTWIVGNYLEKLRLVVTSEMTGVAEIGLEVRGDENRKHG